MADTLVDLILSIEWPFPSLVDIPPEDRPRVAMHIARALREEAQRWEQQAFQLAAGQQDTPHGSAPIARVSVLKGPLEKQKVRGTDQ